MGVYVRPPYLIPLVIRLLMIFNWLIDRFFPSCTKRRARLRARLLAGAGWERGEKWQDFGRRHAVLFRQGKKMLTQDTDCPCDLSMLN